LDGVGPLGFAGNDVGVEAEKKRLSSVILRLLGYGEIELTPVGVRQIG